MADDTWHMADDTRHMADDMPGTWQLAQVYYQRWRSEKKSDALHCEFNLTGKARMTRMIQSIDMA
jgi:hypothetical protein